ncbi:RNA polymerase sigma factor [Fibrella forsythiae]|uniref:Sigma-70 family RNA polymerase sigma factor n=1 Tax=Fibrella forsythiae TaxID=2817061 RepID=A0ABS3JP55_9BACT|nr:sigma-70 family RNA polymerase sigma factor [Fibrella forsythiae]MBO0951789.1 sigma-70 family RNA polymerase sigma factor [Fibrella forsythiae]
MALFGRKRYPTLRDLVLGCQREEAQAQHAFYERYKNRMLGVCVRYARTVAEAEDIFQEAFIRIFQHIRELDKPDSADSWVKSIIVRTAINYYNRTTRSQERFGTYEESTDELVSDDYEAMINRLNLDALLAFINQLPDQYRLVVNLYLIEDYTHADIAVLLNIPEATVRSQYSRAKQLLSKLSHQNGLKRHEFLG